MVNSFKSGIRVLYWTYWKKNKEKGNNRVVRWFREGGGGSIFQKTKVFTVPDYKRLDETKPYTRHNIDCTDWSRGEKVSMRFPEVEVRRIWVRCWICDCEAKPIERRLIILIRTCLEVGNTRCWKIFAKMVCNWNTSEGFF